MQSDGMTSATRRRRRSCRRTPRRPAAVTDGHHPFRIRRGAVSPFQRLPHVSGDRAGDQQHVGMAARGASTAANRPDPRWRAPAVAPADASGPPRETARPGTAGWRRPASRSVLARRQMRLPASSHKPSKVHAPPARPLLRAFQISGSRSPGARGDAQRPADRFPAPFARARIHQFFPSVLSVFSVTRPSPQQHRDAPEPRYRRRMQAAVMSRVQARVVRQMSAVCIPEEIRSSTASTGQRMC